jgi:DNA replication protein DnaC
MAERSGRAFKDGTPHGKTLEHFDCGFPLWADRATPEALVTCAFIREKQNVLVLGPPAVGKSHLAVPLGVEAVKNILPSGRWTLSKVSA